MTPEDKAAIWRALDDLRARIGRLELDPIFSKESLGEEFAVAMSKCMSMDEALVKDYRTEHERSLGEN